MKYHQVRNQCQQLTFYQDYPLIGILKPRKMKIIPRKLKNKIFLQVFDPKKTQSDQSIFRIRIIIGKNDSQNI